MVGHPLAIPDPIGRFHLKSIKRLTASYFSSHHLALFHHSNHSIAKPVLLRICLKLFLDSKPNITF